MSRLHIKWMKDCNYMFIDENINYDEIIKPKGTTTTTTTTTTDPAKQGTGADKKVEPPVV
jgi:hypothetical protein